MVVVAFRASTVAFLYKDALWEARRDLSPHSRGRGIIEGDFERIARSTQKRQSLGSRYYLPITSGLFIPMDTDI